MAKKRETRFKDRIRPKLEALPLTWIVKTQQRSLRGTLDFILCVNGFFVSIELKDGGELDSLQKYNIRKIENCNGYACECDPHNFPHVLSFLETLVKYKWKNKPKFTLPEE